MGDTNERNLEFASQIQAEALEQEVSHVASQVPEPGRKTDVCLDALCGEDMDDRRADAGYTLCVTCAERRERRRH